MDEKKTLVNCNITDCIHNDHCKCSAKEIEVDFNTDDEGICHIECITYQSEC